MKKLTREEMHKQCVREIRGTLIVAILTCLWECIWAFALNGNGKTLLGMPSGSPCPCSAASWCACWASGT